MDLTAYRVTGVNNPAKQVSVTRWNNLLALLEAAGAITAEQYGALADGATNDATALANMQTARLAAQVTGYGYANGLERAIVPFGVSVQNAPLDLYGSGILEGHSGGVFGGSGSVLKFAQNATGIRLQFSSTSGDTTYSTAVTSPSSSGSVVRNIALKSTNTGSDATKPGIRVKAPVQIDNVFIDGFAGDGITWNAQLAGPGSNPNNSSAYGNASCAQVYATTVQNCRDGFHAQGADGSIFLIMGCSAVSNRNVGFYDASMFGGVFLACHASANGAMGYGSDPAQASAHPLFVGCYDEGGQPAPTFSQGTLRVGGSWNPGITTGGYVYASGNRVAVNALYCFGDLDATGQGNIGPQSGSAADGVTYLNNTNTRHDIIFRRWAAGVPTTDGSVYSGTNQLNFKATNYLQHYIGSTRIFYVDSGGVDLDSGKVLRVNGTQVVGARQTGTAANASDLATAITLVNDIKSKLVTHGLIS